MKPATFDYQRVDSAEEAAALLAECGDAARILAGGQSLLPMMNMRVAQPRRLLDISRSPAMARIATRDGCLHIGAAATQAALEWRVSLREECPLLVLALPHVAHFQIRNRGTVAGSIAHADPAAELPLCIVALQGTVSLRSVRGTRDVAADAFFTGMLSTDCAVDEMIEAVQFPLATRGAGYGFEEFALRHGDFALCAVAAVAHERGLRVTVGGISDRPMACDLPALDGSALVDALQAFAATLDARDDVYASRLQRQRWVRELGRRAVAQARMARVAA